jgi:hypothetical protein
MIGFVTGVVDLAHLNGLFLLQMQLLRCTLIMFIFLERGCDSRSDATLSDLKVSGTTIAGFASADHIYC